MFITRETDYAVRCVLYLARGEGMSANVTDISKAMQIPKSFLAKIFQRLTKAGIVKSTRGVKGGYSLARKPSEISLYEVTDAIQDASAFNLCAVDAKKCSLSRECPIHPVWVELRDDVLAKLKNYNFEFLAKNEPLKRH